MAFSFSKALRTHYNKLAFYYLADFLNRALETYPVRHDIDRFVGDNEGDWEKWILGLKRARDILAKEAGYKSWDELKPVLEADHAGHDKISRWEWERFGPFDRFFRALDGK